MIKLTEAEEDFKVFPIGVSFSAKVAEHLPTPSSMDFHKDVLETPPAWLNNMAEQLSTVPASTHKSEAERAAHARRREQVRRAQRNHRERKEKYIKDIEAEVIRLRHHEAAYAEALQIREENKLLKRLLAEHNIPLPMTVGAQISSPISVSVFDRPDGSQDLQAEISPRHNFPSSLPLDHVSESPAAKQTSNVPLAPGSSTPLPEAYLATHQASPGELDPIIQNANASPGENQQLKVDLPQVALDFVLGLEQPCLSHHRTHSFPDGETNGHVLMIQSPILSRCPAPISTDSKKEHIDTSYNWTAPELEVEKLLELSTRLTLDGERIKQHPGFCHLNGASIKALKEMILSEVMCYGFGAVIDEAYFEVMMQQYFSRFISS